MKFTKTCIFAFIAMVSLLLPSISLAASGGGAPLNLQMTSSFAGLLALTVFIIAYLFVMSEEFTHLRKSKPVIVAAGVIWIIVSILAAQTGSSAATEAAIRHNLLEYAELFLFLLVAMTYVNAMEERNVFEALRVWLTQRGFTYRQLFWITGILAFFISPIADNLTTALVMCAVVMAVGSDNKKFVAIGCINIVVAANAGGAFSPFGDITTLMVWQKGILDFADFFAIFLPSVINYLVPAVIMTFAVPKVQPKAHEESISMKVGARRIMVLFLLTIVTAVSFHNFLHLPPAAGMMLGLGYLQFFGYYLKIVEERKMKHLGNTTDNYVFDIFKKVQRAEWDTLLFFYGIILCVGGLSTIGYLSILSEAMYSQWGQALGLAAIHNATPANIFVGVLSAIVDNIPVMFAVLTMQPEMSHGQWLLVTLTAGVGGSMLSIGSAAGVALMGQAKGAYTFFSHLKWTWAIALGYIASIICHLYLNADLFSKPIT
ncbi:Na+/H+ antiporter, NhaD family [Piscirickettsia salmonis]|uniref:Na+/H+ antiporter, NhaD family n=2 Tax=Piscirickettsia salmonis TaxID=1238 RepID=A0A9Q6LUF1_PISSA|nr:sodium:proton antiporter NhaD [Piscirickettsia salmonis]ALA24391.1 citrate transporter family protein [Piscirickettsia salmonis]QGN76764.1 Na+/H+ antiporter, NhaD family [Piscirickettsia salmonis]QGN80354.1 Na+/H+ antiporter, NhaD family [Piscirickettsia salmonis]QGN85374.1 Na+/H+ antiporter, NhaD family [Piscirickettsia salmonis]QGN88880.1 Na+/H+ antiporter, NhaD family [Piscirickettsia salmonis]